MIDSNLWSWMSPVWVLVTILLLLYVRFVRGGSHLQWVACLVGLFVLAMAFVSPIGVLAGGYLFSAHMVQHLLLLLVVPACIVLSLPRETAERWFQKGPVNQLGKWLAVPMLGWTGGVGAMWFWHVPWLCSAATQHTGLGVVRDVSLVAAGLAFWWPIYAPCDRYRLPPLSGMTYLFSACLGCTLLGIYITFAPLSVCPVFANPVDRLGILTSLYSAGFTPGIDQHVGGLIMWVPPCILYTCAIISLLGRWYSSIDAAPTYATGSSTPSGA